MFQAAVVLTALLSLIACSNKFMLLSDKGVEHFDSEESYNARLAEIREKQEKKEREQLSLMRSIGIGDTRARLIEVWGDPQQRDADEKKEHYWYYNNGKPKVFVLEKGVIKAYFYDRSSAHQIESQRVAEEQISLQQQMVNLERQRQADERARELGRAISESFKAPRTTRCTSSHVGNSTYTNCN